MRHHSVTRKSRPATFTTVFVEKVANGPGVRYNVRCYLCRVARSHRNHGKAHAKPASYIEHSITIKPFRTVNASVTIDKKTKVRRFCYKHRDLEHRSHQESLEGLYDERRLHVHCSRKAIIANV